jgi:hypothetical protein
MNAHWLLIFPPVDYAPPRHPFHEVGYVAARLLSLGMRTTFLDLNLAFFEHHLDPVRLDRAIADSRSGSSPARPTGMQATTDRAHARLAESLDVVRGRTGRPNSAEGYRDAMAELELLLQCHLAGRRGESVGFDHYLPGFSLPETARLVAALATDRDSMMWRFVQEHLSAEPPPQDVEMVVLWINNYFQLYGGLLAGAALRRIIPQAKICVVSNLLGRNVQALVRHPELGSYLDALVGSEPETALPEALAWARGELPAERFPNGGVFEGGRFVPSTRTVLADLDELETPLFPNLQRYLYPVPLLEIVGSRGCSYRGCVFCDDVGFGGYNKALRRVRSAHLVARDIERLSLEHGCRAFSFWDADLSAEFLDSLSAALAGRTGAIWSGHTRAEVAADADRCARIRQAGCRLLNLGLESASQRLLDLMKKNQTVGTVRNALARCRAAGIAVHANFIQGFPTESEAELRETVRFIEANLDLLSSFHVYDFHVSRCSAMARRPEAFGIEILPRDEGDIDVILRYRRRQRPTHTNEALLDELRAKHPEMTLDRVLDDIHLDAYSLSAAKEGAR